MIQSYDRHKHNVTFIKSIRHNYITRDLYSTSRPITSCEIGSLCHRVIAITATINLENICIIFNN